MQTVIQVYCTKGPSLRDKIADSTKLSKHSLQVTKEQQPGRYPGWMKVHSTEPDRRGAINIEWDKNTRLLTCRVITKGRNKPDLIICDFLAYLLANQRWRIEYITVVPR